MVSNAGYGLFGAAEELTDEQVDHIIATNLTGSIQLIRAALPHLRAQGGGRIIQISTYGGQVAFPGNSLYHATKWGIEGFASRWPPRSPRSASASPSSNPAAPAPSSATAAPTSPSSCPTTTTTRRTAFLNMLDPANGLAPGDPARMAARIIDSVDTEPAPLRMMLGSQALESARSPPCAQRIADFETQADLAASTDFPPG